MPILCGSWSAMSLTPLGISASAGKAHSTRSTQKSQSSRSVSPASDTKWGFGVPRGTYRTSPAKWFIPETIKAPAGSSKDASTGGMISKPNKAGDGAWELVIDVPAKLAPLFIAFHLQGQGQPEVSRGGQKFAVPVGITAGRLEPLGTVPPKPLHPSKLSTCMHPSPQDLSGNVILICCMEGC